MEDTSIFVLLLVVFTLPCRVHCGVDANQDFISTNRISETNNSSRLEGGINSNSKLNGSKDGPARISPTIQPTSQQCNSNDCQLVIIPGPQGPSGPPGQRGIPGSPGIPGYPGMNGHNGEPGICNCLSGQKGSDGTSGREGIIGNEGPSGPHGPPGDDGPTGPIGEKGDPGICTEGIGPKGDPGSTGVTGKRGVQGDKGDTGKPGQDAICDPQMYQVSVEETESSRRPISAHRDRRRRYSAFSVSRYGTKEANEETEIITWDHEFSNVGGDFSLESGIFNCSLQGFYFFTFNIYKSSTSNYPLVRLMFNGDVQVSVIDADYWDSEDSSTNSVILELGLGDQVWLELYEGRVLHSSYYRYTTFSGTLLHAT